MESLAVRPLPFLKPAEITVTVHHFRPRCLAAPIRKSN